MAESSAHMQFLNNLRYRQTGVRFTKLADGRMHRAEKSNQNTSPIERTNDREFDNSSNLQFGNLIAHHGQQINYNVPVIDLTDGNEQYSDHSTPVTYLTNDNVQYISQNTPVIDLTDDNDQCISQSIPFIDLSDHNRQYTSHNIPVIDLTDDNDLCIDRCIPVIDLTNDDDEGIYTTKPVTDLTDVSDHGISYNIPVIDLTDVSDHGISYNIPVIDLTDYTNKDKNVTPSIKHKYQDNNRCLPVVDLMNSVMKDSDEHIVDTIPITKMTKAVVGSNNCSRMPIKNLNDDENAVNKARMPILKKLPSDTSYKFQNDKHRILDMNLSSGPMINCFKDKEYNLKKDANFSQSNSQSNTVRKAMFDPEPLSHPILLRRSLSRSNANTSKKCLIESSHREQIQKLQITNEEKISSMKAVFFCFWTFIFTWILKPVRRIVYFK